METSLCPKIQRLLLVTSKPIPRLVENMVTPTELGAPVETTSRHLQLLPRPELYAKLADLQVHHGNTILPCHSSALAMHSNVLSTMFEDMPKEEWASGVTVALADHALEDVIFFLNLVHSPGIQKDGARKALGDAHTMLGVAQLAHKLDSPLVLEKIDSYLSVNIDVWKHVDPEETTNVPLYLLLAAEKLNMPKTKAACMMRVLDTLKNEAPGVDELEKKEITDHSGWSKEVLEALSPETLVVLLQDVFRARSQERQNRRKEVPERKKQRWEARHREFWCKVCLFLLILVIGPTPIGFLCCLCVGLTDPKASSILPSRLYSLLKEKGVDRLALPVFSVGLLFLCWFFFGVFGVCIFLAPLYFCYVVGILINLPAILDVVEELWEKEE